MMLTLWDLLEPLTRKLRPPVEPSPLKSKPEQRRREAAAGGVDAVPMARPAPARQASAGRTVRVGKPPLSAMQAKYDAVVEHMLKTHQVRVRKWRTSMSGVAWYVTYQDGRISRLIEAPKPKGPMSAAIFLHEIGHHAIGFNVYKPRCLEEYHAWRWSLEQMESHGLNITDAVRYRMSMSLWYAVQKARRRGIRAIPGELVPYMERPTRPNTKKRTRR